MQTILGSGGAIGTELALALTKYTKKIRLVSRNPKKVNPTDELVKADLLNPEEVKKAVIGSSIVYLTVGFEYKASVWAKKWPLLIDNVIAACESEGCKLVFFDNIYMYDANHLNGMTEETPINPPSKKGKIRAEVAKKIMDKVKAGKLTALIARSADFYGPSINQVSLLTESVIKPLSAGKKANWIGSADYKHSFTYTPDAGRATALLGNTPDAYGQVWHLPTAPNPFTGKEWIDAFAGELGVPPKFLTAPKFMVRILGLFIPIMREFVEMTYQYDRDYVFDSSKFEKRFNMKPTPYAKGIIEIMNKDFESR